MKYQALNKTKCGFVLFGIFIGLAVIDNVGASLRHKNSGLIRVTLIYPRFFSLS
jgi:hypothetical protein